MRSTQEGSLSPGDIGDPVADAIRAEQAHDAAPQPGEVKNNKELECDECETVAEDVERREIIMASCTRLQAPDRPWKNLCTECDQARDSLKEQQRAKAKKQLETDYQDDPVAIAFYECGRAKFLTGEGTAVTPRAFGEPKTPIRCSCGERLDDVEFLNS